MTPIQPSWIPANVKFELDDCNREWTWPENTFDFIHLRMLVGVVTDWHTLFRRAFYCARPGGYVESMCTGSGFYSNDGSVKKGSALDQWSYIFDEGSKKVGRTFRVIDDDLQRKGMEEAGFVDVTVRDFEIPFGTWPKDKRLSELGQWWKIATEADLEGMLCYRPPTVGLLVLIRAYRVSQLSLQRCGGLDSGRNCRIRSPYQKTVG